MQPDWEQGKDACSQHPVPHGAAAPSHCNMATKGNKEVKLSVFIDNVVTNIENSKELTENTTVTNK